MSNSLANISISAVLEIGIFASHIMWRHRNREVLRAAKRLGKSYDEYVVKEKDPSVPNTAATSTHDLNNTFNEEKRQERKPEDVDLEKGLTAAKEQTATS